MFGLTDEVKNKISACMYEIPVIKKVLIYGSRAKGCYRNGSDIDLALFGEGLNLNNAVYPLMEKIEELDMPWSFDITIFSYIKNRKLIEHIERIGQIFYERARINSRVNAHLESK